MVFGKRFKVKIVPELLVQGIPRAGLMDPNGIIYIQRDIQSEMEGTLLHELTHAFCDRGALHQTGIPHEVFEIFAELNSTFMTETFKLTNH